MTPPFTAIGGFTPTAFYRAPPGAFRGRTAAQGGFTASAYVWPQGSLLGDTYFANTDSNTYGWWIERDAANNLSVNVITAPAGVLTAAVTSPPGSVGKPTLIQLTLTSGNILYIIVDGTVFSQTDLGADVYVPAPAASVATLGARDITGLNYVGGLISGAAYVEPAEDISVAGVRWAAVTVARDMVDPPAVYGNVASPYTNLYSARRGNNGQGNPVAFPGLGFLTPNATWRDEHGLITLTREGNADLQVATILNS
jgi:hypothetical protein